MSYADLIRELNQARNDFEAAQRAGMDSVDLLEKLRRIKKLTRNSLAAYTLEKTIPDTDLHYDISVLQTKLSTQE